MNPTVWLVWSVTPAGTNELRAICTTRALASEYCSQLAGSHGCVWVEEPRQLDQLWPEE